MEFVLLCSCLALPKVAFAIRSCPPSKIRGATAAFDHAMREAVSDLVGTPLSDWVWLKATLSSSLGGLTIQEHSVHAPATFLSSLNQTHQPVSQILRCDPGVSPHIASALAELAEVTGNPDWHSLKDVDIPFQQRGPSPVPLIKPTIPPS